jgi:hypothetical protein
MGVGALRGRGDRRDWTTLEGMERWCIAAWWTAVRSGGGEGDDRHAEERSAGVLAERRRADRPRSAPRKNERPGARWPGPISWWPYWKRLGWDASGSADADKPARPPAVPASIGNRRRGRGGARAIQPIPEARPRPTCSAPGSVRPARWGVGGAPEHRPSVSLLEVSTTRSGMAAGTHEGCGAMRYGAVPPSFGSPGSNRSPVRRMESARR